MTPVTDSEIFMTEMYDEGVVTEVIRPAAIVPEEAARAILMELALRDVQLGGHWLADPSRWNELVGESGNAELGGALKEIAQTTPWLVEKILGDALGPVAGQRVADLGRSLLQFPRYATERFADSAVSYARDEAQLLAPAAAMRRLTTEVAEVGVAVDALAARIAALNERLPRPD